MRNIMILGDIHGNPYRLRDALDAARLVGGITHVIQVGDLGLFPGHSTEHFKHALYDYQDIKVLAIDGNHDNCDYWNTLPVDEIHPLIDKSYNAWFVPRGSVLRIGNRTVAFMGGAASIDRDIRIRNGWFHMDSENITEIQRQTLIDNTKNISVDMFITHCPPSSVIETHFNSLDKLRFGVSVDWTDPNQHIIEDLWGLMNFPPIYSGHMHRTVVGPNYRILNIDEYIVV